MFRSIQYYPGDPILSILEEFNKDTRQQKVNLSVGIYFDEAGKIPLLNSVQIAEKKLLETPKNRLYLPMNGDASFVEAVQKLIFGENNPVIHNQRLATIQSIGSSTALKIGADFIRQWFPESKIYISDPTWDNHRSIFEGSSITVETYPYYDASNGGIKFDEMINFISNLDEKSIILLHPCCHNPTGEDLSKPQWDELLTIILKKNLIPFMDIAYQGFGANIDEDAYAIRKATELGLSLFVTHSFSKNLALYSERVGSLTVVCPSKEESRLVLSQLKYCVRRIYSSPPSHGAFITSLILNDEQLKAEWIKEVYQMRDRIQSVRKKLYDLLSEKVPNKDFNYLISQKGMFSYTGLSLSEVNMLKEKYAVYLISSGRMCVAGLNDNNVEYVAESIASILK